MLDCADTRKWVGGRRGGAPITGAEGASLLQQLALLTTHSDTANITPSRNEGGSTPASQHACMNSFGVSFGYARTCSKPTRVCMGQYMREVKSQTPA